MKKSTVVFDKNAGKLSTPALRFDGLYKYNDGYSYLRFYPSGLVINVSSTGTPIQVARWFNESHDAVSSGRYVCEGDKLSFSVVIDQVRGVNRNCHYEGVIKKDGRLLLNWYSEATDRVGIYCYDFYPFE